MDTRTPQPFERRRRTRTALAGAARSTGNLVERFSAVAGDWTGRTPAFAAAVLLVIGWAASGPLFRYSDPWQLFINTVTNLVTFLMVFLIQRAQNKDTMALQIKVNELIAAQAGARNALIAVERLSEDDLRALQARFQRLAEVAGGAGPVPIQPPTTAVPPARGDETGDR